MCLMIEFMFNKLKSLVKNICNLFTKKKIILMNKKILLI